MIVKNNPQKIIMHITRCVSDLDWRFLFLVIPLFSLLVFFSLSSAPVDSFPPFQSFIFNFNRSLAITNSSVSPTDPTFPRLVHSKSELNRSRIAVCLVGGARRFELTGPSIVERILNVYPTADLFLHSPMDTNAFKFSLLKVAPRLAAIRIFEPKVLPETEAQVRVLTAENSPNGIQGLVQYFNLVEECLTMIQSHQQRRNFTYDWIVRTRVDGYWNAPLTPENFIPGKYVVPTGSSYGGLNDRFGIGDFNTSIAALSRLSLIPELDSAGFSQLNSESALKAQLITRKVQYARKRLPFCIVSERKYVFPPSRLGVPVAALASPGPLSGAKCRPCTPVCQGPCVADVMLPLFREWGWTYWRNGTIELCDAHREWEKGWEKIFDGVVGKKLAAERRRVKDLKFEECVGDFGKMKRRASSWESPPVEEICRLGLGMTQM
ncbi:hypothetical protein SLE2022_122310 [Rubroshorea leprosula]